MKTIKKPVIASFLFLLVPFQAFGNPTNTDIECKDPVTEVSALAAAIEKTTDPKFDEKFCQSFKVACEKYSYVKSEENVIKQKETYYKSLGDSVAKMKENLETLEKQLAEVKAKDPVDYIQIKKLQVGIKASKKTLSEYETDLEKYKAQGSDPTKIPVLLKELGIGLFGEEKKKFLELKQEKDYLTKSQTMMEYYNELPQAIDLQKKIIEQFMKTMTAKGQDSENSWALDDYKYQLVRYENDFKQLQEHLKDPTKVPHPVKAKGYGLTEAEKKDKKRKEIEEKYVSNKSAIEQYKTTIEKIAKTIKQLKEQTPPDSDAEYYEQMSKNYEKKLKESETLEAKYQAYLKDPKAQPNFLDENPFDKDFDDDSGYAGSADPCATPKNIFINAASTLSYHKAGTCNMTAAELVMLKNYSDSGYSCLNGYLRQKTKIPEMDHIVGVLNAGLNKLPSYQGIVKRGATLPQNIRDQHKVGETVTYDAYTSTSTVGGFGGSDIFYIYSSTGKPIMGMSSHDGEYEVLFKSGAKFKIIETKNDGGTNYYVMKDVSEGKDDPAIDKQIIDKLVNPEEPKPVDEGTEPKKETYYCPLEDTAKIPKYVKQVKLPQNSYPKPPVQEPVTNTTPKEQQQ